MKKKILLVTSFVAVTLIAFVVFIDGNTSSADQGVKVDEEWENEVEEQKEQEKTSTDEQVIPLTVGGNTNPERYSSNFHLYSSHLSIGVLTHNITFNNGGEPLDEEIYRDTLKGLKGDLERIEYEGDKEEDLQKAINLTNKAIEDDAQKGDQILEDIHEVIHGLDRHFNSKEESPDVEVDELGVPINEEDRIPNYEYNNN